MDRLMALGRQDPADKDEPFNMTVLAIKASSFANGVAKLHGDTARNMWARVWPEVPVDEVPITSITNGIHARFWISREIGELFTNYIGPSWTDNPADKDQWKKVWSIPDAELWRMHERRRERLVGYVRRHVASFVEMRGDGAAELHAASEILDPEVLTIGVARRFATYKRLTLILSDLERTLKLVRHPERPLQIVYSGKAHPQDTEGKELIRDIVHFIREHNLAHRVVFLEDYDINVARHMVQGVDCWLNTPRRPLEASGTSGMKAAANGALNISIPDGWWAEAETLPGEHGWSIGRGELYERTEEQDRVESEALYEIIEHEIAPLFYDRGSDGLPRDWIRRMKSMIENCLPVFNTHRMVSEYAERAYAPSSIRRTTLRANKRARSKALAEWKKKVRAEWKNVSITKVGSGETEGLAFGSELAVTASVELGALTEDDVAVEAYYGPVDTYRQLKSGTAVPMKCLGKAPSGAYEYEGAVPCDATGRLGFAVRVVPQNEDLAHRHELGLIAWA
jgi:starch phosphorylase